MLKIEQVNHELCIKCKKCVNICLVRLFTIKEDEKGNREIYFADPYRFCFRCGHCLSICPTNAIEFSGAEEPFEFEEVKEPEKIISYDDFYKAVRSRRTTRVFLDKEVEKEKIEKVLEAIRYAPTASNRQRQRFVVITDKEIIAEFSSKVMNFFLRFEKWLKLRYILYPFVPSGLRKRIMSKRTKMQLSSYRKRTLAGEDLVFYHAPCVIVLHSTSYSQMAASDGGIALTHAMFAAQALGLGTAWIGFAQEYLWRNKKYRKRLGIPDKNNCYGVLILGYPKYQFERAPPRRRLKVKWI